MTCRTAARPRHAATPDPAALSGEQQRFMDLHRLHVVTEWRWYFGESQLRAVTDRGRTATISRDSLVGLIAADLMTFSHGYAMKLTDSARELLR